MTQSVVGSKLLPLVLFLFVAGQLLARGEISSELSPSSDDYDDEVSREFQENLGESTELQMQEQMNDIISNILPEEELKQQQQVVSTTLQPEIVGHTWPINGRSYEAEQPHASVPVTYKARALLPFNFTEATLPPSTTNDLNLVQNHTETSLSRPETSAAKTKNNEFPQSMRLPQELTSQKKKIYRFDDDDISRMSFNQVTDLFMNRPRPQISLAGPLLPLDLFSAPKSISSTSITTTTTTTTTQAPSLQPRIHSQPAPQVMSQPSLIFLHQMMQQRQLPEQPAPPGYPRQASIQSPYQQSSKQQQSTYTDQQRHPVSSQKLLQQPEKFSMMRMQQQVTSAAQLPPSSSQAIYSLKGFAPAERPLYLGHNPFIEILRPHSYADDNIVTLNLSHSHIYEIDTDAFVGQRFELIDLSNNKLGLIHRRSFRIGPSHSRHQPFQVDHHQQHHQTRANAGGNSTKYSPPYAGPTRRPPPAHPKSVTIDFSHNPAIVALSGAFDHIDVPNCLLNFTNTTVELKFGAFKKYFREHPGHLIDIESVDCCEQEWLLGYKHNFVPRTHCEHDHTLFLSRAPQQTIIDSCIAYVTSARHSMTIQGPSLIHRLTPRNHLHAHPESHPHLTYLILGGTAMILTSLSIYIIFYMFSLKAAFVHQMQQKS